MVITPEADIAYSYETLNTTPPSLIQVGGGSFTVPGLMPSRSQLTLGGGITAQITDTPRLRGRLSHHPADGKPAQPDDLPRPRLQVLRGVDEYAFYVYS